MTRFLVGIDDTDNTESRGTGHRSRTLRELLAGTGVEGAGITRHQLLVDPRIPYTSHNSSACLEVSCPAGREAELIAACRAFLMRDSAPGSDAGLCVAQWQRVDADVVGFGERAKRSVLTADEAKDVASAHDLHLEGLTGDGGGVIGALAGVGLRAGGADGRFLWLPGLRDLRGIHRAGRLSEQLRLDAIETEAGRPAGRDDRVEVGEWPRPLLRGKRIVLIVEEGDHGEYDWIVSARSRIKQLSE